MWGRLERWAAKARVDNAPPRAGRFSYVAGLFLRARTKVLTPGPGAHFNI